MSDKTGLKLCLLEDDPIMGESLCYRFELEGFACDWYQSAQAARPHLIRGGYAALISDIRLPDMHGGTLFTQLQDEGCRLPPTLFITGHGQHRRRRGVAQAGSGRLHRQTLRPGQPGGQGAHGLPPPRG